MSVPLALPDPTTNLPADVLRKIVRRLPCIADRDGTPEVCKKWRSALAEEEPPLPSAAPRPLPWLLLPSAGAASTRVRCYYCGDGCNFRSRLSPTHGARCFGSHEGGWIFLSFHQTHGHAIVNLRSRSPKRAARLLPLPDLLRSRRGNRRPEDMVILAATLSSSPDGKNCIAAGIVMRWHLIAGPRQFAFWRLGDDVAVDGAMAPDALHLNSEVEDLIYHDGAFRFLTSRGAIIVCTPIFYPDGQLRSTSESLLKILQPEHLREPVHARYLVESRGKLLMVVKFKPSYLPTSELQVFEIVEEVSSFAGIEEVVPSWKKLGSLDGRILFVGRGCSRSYEVGDHGIKGLEEGIYFLDDSTFYDGPMMFRIAKDRCYACNDNGKWFDGHLEPCFPEQGPSIHSPPTWVFP